MPLRYLREVRRHFTLTALAVGMVVLTAPAHAQVWNEVGDAGPFPATAQQTVGAGLLTTIRGNLASASDVDMYCIHLTAVPPAGSSSNNWRKRTATSPHANRPCAKRKNNWPSPKTSWMNKWPIRLKRN